MQEKQVSFYIKKPSNRAVTLIKSLSEQTEPFIFATTYQELFILLSRNDRGLKQTILDSFQKLQHTPHQEKFLKFVQKLKALNLLSSSEAYTNNEAYTNFMKFQNSQNIWLNDGELHTMFMRINALTQTLYIQMMDTTVNFNTKGLERWQHSNERLNFILDLSEVLFTQPQTPSEKLPTIDEELEVTTMSLSI